MKLTKRDWWFLVAVVVVVAALVVLSLVGRKPKPILAIPEHQGVTAATPRTDCMVCHDPTNPNAPNPLPASHPLVWKKEAVSCVSCHAPAASQPKMP